MERGVETRHPSNRSDNGVVSTLLVYITLILYIKYLQININHWSDINTLE